MFHFSIIISSNWRNPYYLFKDKPIFIERVKNNDNYKFKFNVKDLTNDYVTKKEFEDLKNENINLKNDLNKVKDTLNKLKMQIEEIQKNNNKKND